MILIAEDFLDGCFFLIRAHKGIENDLIFVGTALGRGCGIVPERIF